VQAAWHSCKEYPLWPTVKAFAILTTLIAIRFLRTCWAAPSICALSPGAVYSTQQLVDNVFLPGYFVGHNARIIANDLTDEPLPPPPHPHGQLYVMSKHMRWVLGCTSTSWCKDYSQ